ncbi:hypothetical protein FOMPIDRAFT_1053023 [Fomitopsis schrenkii]|uniref:Uncharacterized protein n=1 Tax=Fomitopsis schrenkii TaxID=2126942 RepID=S8FEF6_FOMSC|nr:hypothetical protein FOMPIDRAFT_1053023 [Fomitopsis schrenkii]
MAAQLVLSQLVGNKMKNNGSAIILTAPGAAGGGISSIAAIGGFCCMAKPIYKVTGGLPPGAMERRTT